ncbi:hypothetical protein WICPIJ_007855 [Wickerhamomyces pijperi]|uniref:Altered inheritance of mitochondria protein 23, mitochondrial n=1 Tax=Wickerhamomyces pijperi TaxID=599730 RepID=A0A9P8Q0V2_WICPI|nr:hypothetical protein WICPIJ_007855 [Wickerhamomyces pijperi]
MLRGTVQSLLRGASRSYASYSGTPSKKAPFKKGKGLKSSLERSSSFHENNQAKVSGIHIPGNTHLNHTPSDTPREKKQTPLQVLKHQLQSFDPETFQCKVSASESENGYLTEMIKRVHEINPHFHVVFKTESGIQQGPFSAFFNKVKDNETFDILTVKKEDDNPEGRSFPFLVTVNKVDALKSYRDKMSVELNKKFGRTVEKKRSTNIKYVKVSWSINQFDLESQKTNEILSLLKKKTKLAIIIDTKEALERLNLTSINNFEMGKSHSSINDLERIKREKILTYLLKLFEEKAVIDSSKTNVSQFDLSEKIMINVSPLAPQAQAQTETQATADNDANTKKSKSKMSRQEKQKLREQQKKAEIEEKRRLFEESQRKLH